MVQSKVPQLCIMVAPATVRAWCNATKQHVPAVFFYLPVLKLGGYLPTLVHEAAQIDNLVDGRQSLKIVA